MIKTIFNHTTNEMYIGEVVDVAELLKQPQDGWTEKPLPDAATVPTLAKGSLTPEMAQEIGKAGVIVRRPTAQPLLPPSEAAISPHPASTTPARTPNGAPLVASGETMAVPSGTGTGEPARVAPETTFGVVKGVAQKGGTRSRAK